MRTGYKTKNCNNNMLQSRSKNKAGGEGDATRQGHRLLLVVCVRGKSRQVEYMLQIPNNFTYLCPRAFRVSSIEGRAGGGCTQGAGGEFSRKTGTGTTLVSNGVNAKQSAMRHQ